MIENEYKYRINKVIDHIEKNMADEFLLDELADISHFSKFHFSRIFKGITGETPFQLIFRIRLEKAAALLIRGNDSISDIAYKCGFRSLSVFSKNFKSYFKESATSFRKKNSNLNKVNSISDKKELLPSIYICEHSKLIKWKVDMKNNESIEVKELAELPVVYLRHIGPYQGNSVLFEKLFSKLFAWAAPKGLLDNGDFQTVIVYHDDPDVSDKSKLRTSICLTAKESTEVDGEIGKMVLEKGKYVVARFNLKPDEFQVAWDWIMGSWFPSSGYQPDDKVCFELYPEEPKNGVFKVDICVPVRKL